MLHRCLHFGSSLLSKCRSSSTTSRNTKTVLFKLKTQNGPPFLSPIRFSVKNIDKAIKFFINNQAAAYLQMANENFEAMDEESRKLAQWDMNGTFTVTQPSEDVVSVVFTIESYSGGAHGNYSEEVLNSDLKTDRELQFQDLFEEPSVALKLLSQYCASALKEKNR